MARLVAGVSAREAVFIAPGKGDQVSVARARRSLRPFTDGASLCRGRAAPKGPAGIAVSTSDAAIRRASALAPARGAARGTAAPPIPAVAICSTRSTRARVPPARFSRTVLVTRVSVIGLLRAFAVASSEGGGVPVAGARTGPRAARRRSFIGVCTAAPGPITGRPVAGATP